MKKRLLRNVRPDIFNTIKNKNIYYDVGVGYSSNVEFICPRCGNVVIQSVSNVVRQGLSCKMCGDGISFGEKFVFNVLEQLHLNFNTHVVFSWSDRRIYDIMVSDNGIDTIIEVHGKQHYNGGFETYGGRDYLQEIENDNYKLKLAFANGFNQTTYTVVDCRESAFEYIKHSILKNDFFRKYNLDGIDWNKCMENAMSSYAIKAQKLWDEGCQIQDIVSQLKISRTTIRKYLKQGAEIGKCSYSVEESFKRRRTGTFVPTPPNTTMVAYLNEKQIFYSIADASIYTGIPYQYILKFARNKYKDFSRVRIGRNTEWKIINKNDVENMINVDGYVIVGSPPTSTVAG